jgi:hypothetical protein
MAAKLAFLIKTHRQETKSAEREIPNAAYTKTL